MSLEEKRKRYDIPDVPYLPIGKNVIVWRLMGDEKTKGGLYVPQEHQDVKSRGILLAAGLAARDVLADGLIDIGDEVYFGHYAGRDREVKRDEGSSAKKLWEGKVEDILGSVEALDRSKAYKIEVVDTDDGTQRQWRKK